MALLLLMRQATRHRIEGLAMEDALRELARMIAPHDDVELSSQEEIAFVVLARDFYKS